MPHVFLCTLLVLGLSSAPAWSDQAASSEAYPPSANSLDGKPLSEFSSRELNSQQLKARMQEFTEQGLSITHLQTEMYTKQAIPLTSAFVTLLAVPMGLWVGRWRRLSRWGAMLMPIVLTVLWYVLYSQFSRWGESGTLSPFWAAWGTNLSFAIPGGLWLLRSLWR
jgi:lipopolysaccharide export LptBFGC system permease protein LptF